jgi:heptosyltransferase-1
MQHEMPRILLIKTSSLGDVVHNLPVVSDIVGRFPCAEIDWVIEESFAAIPQMHAGVARVFPVAMRRWRNTLLRAETHLECRAFISQVRNTVYDAIVDTQGLIKSALLTCAARGPRYGLDWSSSREPLRMFYDRTFHVPWDQHAVARNRSLAAQALGYSLNAQINYGITAPRRTFPWLVDKRYAVLLHATSAARKLWPEDRWQELSRYLFAKDIVAVLPWGNAAERARSERIAKMTQNAIVPPMLILEEMAALLAQAQFVVGVDTGLAHLAAALHVPTVGIYLATNPAATGIYARSGCANVGGAGQLPTGNDVIAAVERLIVAI